MAIKDRATMVKQLAELPKLYAQARTYFTYDHDKLVDLGIISKADALVLYEHRELVGKLDILLRQVEDSFPYPNIMTDKRIPKEYLEAVTRFDNLKEYVAQESNVRSVIYNLRQRMQFASSIPEELDFSVLADQCCQLYNNLPDQLMQEYYNLKTAIERKEREGSKVKKLRQELFGIREAKIRKAKTEAETKFYRANANIYARKKKIDLKIETNRKAKLEPIRTQIKAILTKAIETS